MPRPAGVDLGGGGTRPSGQGPVGSKSFRQRVQSDLGAAVNVPAILGGLARTARDVPKTRFDMGRGFYLAGHEAEIDAFRFAHPHAGFGDAAKALTQSGTLPGLLPGMATLAGGRRQAAEHPLLTGLDVLPFASAAGKVAGLGEFARIAETGAARAAAEGASANVARTAGEALAGRAAQRPLRTLAKAAGREAFGAFEKAAPKPANVLKASRFGSDVRGLMELVGPSGRYQRTLTRAVHDWTKQVGEAGRRSGLDEAGMAALVDKAERGAPGWREALTPQERAFMAFYDDHVATFLHKGVAEKRMYMHDGEAYTRAEHETIRRALRRADGLEAMAARLEAAGAPATDLRARAARLRTSAASVVPGKWKGHPAINEAIAEKVKVLARSADPTLTEQAWAGIVEHLYSRPGGVPGVDEAHVRKIAKQTHLMWRELKAQGYDPVFIHHVGEDAAGRLAAAARVTPTKVPATTSDVRARAYIGGAPYVRDLQVALSAQGVEHLAQETTRHAVQAMTDAGYVTSRAELEVRYAAEARASGRPAGDLIRRDHLAFDPQAIFPFKGRLPRTPEGAMIPRSLAKTIEVLRAGDPMWKKAASLPTKVMTMSVLRLNPGYYLHIALASSTILLAKEGAGPLRYFAAALRDLKAGRAPAELAVHTGDAMLPEAALNLAQGRTIGRMIKAIPGGLERTTGWIHDMSEQMTYLYELDRGKAEGLTPTMAHSAAVDAANSLFQRWDRMTPFERTAVRWAFPFYGWSKFLMQFVLSYPFDHPLRASIIGHYARAELDDWKTGLPQRFMSWFFFGHPDGSGARLAIPTTGAVPFLATPNLLTISGIYSHANPLIHIGGQMLGLTKFGGPDLYATLDYDPYSGQAVARAPSLRTVAEEAISPQLSSIESIVGWNAQMRSLRAKNPEAWRRLVREQLGLRFYPSRINVETEISKARKAQVRAERSQAKAAQREPSAAPAGGRPVGVQIGPAPAPRP